MFFIRAINKSASRALPAFLDFGDMLQSVKGLDFTGRKAFLGSFDGVDEVMASYYPNKSVS